MDKNEKLKLGDIYFAPKEFFLNNSDGKLKQKIESYAEVRKDGMVMCAVVENKDSVFPHQSEGQKCFRLKKNIYRSCKTPCFCLDTLAALLNNSPEHRAA